MMMTLALAAFFPTAGHAAAWGVLLAGFLEFLLVGGNAARVDVLPHFAWPKLDAEVVVFLKRFGPATIGSAGTQIALFADTIIADGPATAPSRAMLPAPAVDIADVRVYRLPGAEPLTQGCLRYATGEKGL